MLKLGSGLGPALSLPLFLTLYKKFGGGIRVKNTLEDPLGKCGHAVLYLIAKAHGKRTSGSSP